MNASVTRPLFAEGQILTAAALDQMTKYPRARSERHNRFVHRWGIVTGLTLVAEPTEDALGNAFSKITLQPGLAIDGEGREILVTGQVELNDRRFRLTIGNSIDPDKSYPVFLISQYRSVSGDTGIADPCGEQAGRGQIEEGFEVVFGQPGDETTEHAASPISAAPSDDEGASDWPVLVGFVTWADGAQNFADIDGVAARKHRPFIGLNAASLAGDDTQVQVQPKADLLPGDTVFQVRQTDDGPELCFGTFKAKGTDIEALFKVNAAGDVTAKGSLTGKRTGNSVQVQSGLASDGIILPLPPGVTEAQLADETATMHITVAPMIDAAHSPDPTADYAAMVQECRVDDQRRVHCRIAWTSLPIGPAAGGALGDDMIVGPGAVRFLVAVATTEGEE